MADEYKVFTIPAFNRVARVFVTSYPDFARIYERALEILRRDALNREGDRDILKLEFIPIGDGQYRLRVGRYRFRYDVHGKIVILKWCGISRDEAGN
jgi:hypothetical protein